MNKDFKLTIELTAKINDIVENIGGEEQIGYIQEILDHAKNDNEFLVRYFKHRLCELHFKDIKPDIIPVIHTFKDYLELFSSILPKISMEARDFLEQLFGDSSKMNHNNSEEAEKYLRLILSQFDFGKILRVELNLIDNT